MLTNKPAASTISEDQLLNFLVNALSDEFTLDFGANADVDAEDIFEVLVGACADGTSVSTLCENSMESQHENTIFYHLREKFDLSSVEQAGNTLLQTEVLETLPEQVEVVVDLHLRPYYGDEDVLVELAEETGLGGNEIRRAIGDEAILDRLQEEFSKPNGRASPVSPR